LTASASWRRCGQPRPRSTSQRRLGSRFGPRAADRLLGRLVNVTPPSKVVGDLALQLVGSGVAVEDFGSDPGKAMKMEAAITAPRAGIVSLVAFLGRRRRVWLDRPEG
jgi:hypothetical protein